MSLSGAGATVIAAALATIVALLSLRQTHRATLRDAWWKRAEWAIDKSLSPEPETREVGAHVMLILARDTRATDQDLRVLQAALRRALDTV
jgi:hypothetical protein